MQLQPKKILRLALFTIPACYLVFCVSDLTVRHSYVSDWIYKSYDRPQKFLLALGFYSSSSVVGSAVIYGLVIALIGSFLKQRYIERLKKPSILLVIAITVGVFIFNFFSGHTIETHYFHGTKYPDVEIRNQGFLDSSFYAYLKRPFYIKEIGHIPTENTGVEKCPVKKVNSVVMDNHGKKDDEPLFEIYWAENGTKMAFSCRGWFVAGVNLNTGHVIYPARGEVRINQFMGQ